MLYFLTLKKAVRGIVTRNTKLILWPAGGQSIKLTRQIADILKRDYKLEDRVHIMHVLNAQESEGQQKENKIDKGPLRPIVTDFFDDWDPRIEGGLPEFEELNRHYLAVVKYMREPDSDKSISDFLIQTVALFYAVNDNCSPLRKALVVPYMPFLRAHSVDKYKQRGFGESDRLKMLADILALCKINDLFLLHPHSDKIDDYCSDRGISVHSKDTFRNYQYIDYRKLGFSSKEIAEKVLYNQQPTVNEIKSLREEALKHGKKFYVIVPDDGAEHLVETLARDAGIDYDSVLNILKDRIDAGEVRVVGFKDFCKINANDFEGATAHPIINNHE